MTFRFDLREPKAILNYGFFWVLVLAPLAVFVGSACALFLWALDLATRTRFNSPALLWWLPLAGVAIAMAYHLFGKVAERGNNLIVDQIHEPGGGVPFAMTPLVLSATVVTHLFGGSAGREGTAIQMGGSIASTWGRGLRMNRGEHRTLLMAGTAAGFGAVFGTPLAGAVFALEVLAIGHIEYGAIIPCLLASIMADKVCAWWGIQHVTYHIGIFADPAAGPLPAGLLLYLKVALAGALFGLVAVLFSESAHRLSAGFKRLIPWYWLRPVAGAALLIGMTLLLGTRDYLGLGVSNPAPGAVTISSAFLAGGATPWSWLWKTLSTTITLGSGFKGGEVTPLFYVGATLGNALSRVLAAPPDLLAGLGFVAVFAGATNTPLACTIMGLELFGSGQAPLFALACYSAYLFSGHTGIYLSQRVERSKGDQPEHPTGMPLRSLREAGRPALEAGPASVFADPGRARSVAPVAASKLVSRDLGQLRIYLPRREPIPGRVPGGAARFLHQHLIALARQDGLMNATAHPVHDPHSTADLGRGGGHGLYVELVGPPAKLERFCARHRVWLRGRVILHKHVEHWTLMETGVRAAPASPKEA